MLGSGPGHLALFGYDPTRFVLGRGALSAAGLEVELRPGVVAARGNLATVDADGDVVDRRAGRIADEDARRVVDALSASVGGVEFHHEKGHRLLVVFRGEGLDPRIADTDPQRTGVPPSPGSAGSGGGGDRRARAEAASDPGGARRRAGRERAPAPRLRHASGSRFTDRTGLRAAPSPSTRCTGDRASAGLRRAGAAADRTRYGSRSTARTPTCSVHVKDADAAGEDGDRTAKIAAIERVDAAIPTSGLRSNWA